MRKSNWVQVLVVVALLSGVAVVQAESMAFVPVGDVGNAADTRLVGWGSTYYGAVDHFYAIGKYEVSNAQYCAFLNAVAQSDAHGLYNDNMGNRNYTTRGGIARTGTSGSYSYSVIVDPAPDAADRGAMPVNFVDWMSAARMANWMHNGMTNDPASTESGAYDFSGGIPATHTANAKYWIPSINEWYKAAFYKGSGLNAGYWTYANQSDSAPSGGPYDQANRANYQADNYNFGEGYDAGDLVAVDFYTLAASAYGTFQQSGNLYEWMENKSPYSGGWDQYLKTIWGGCWKYNDTDQLSYQGASHGWADDSTNGGTNVIGFRLAAAEVPEPVSIILLGLGAVGLLRRRS